MISKSLLSVLLIIVLVNFVHGKQFDFCTFGLSSNLNGLAYSITKSPDDRAEQFQEAFEDTLREDKIANEFKKKFGESLDTVKSFNWHFNFGSLGRINISEILPSSLHCIYVYDRELFTESYNQPIITAEEAVEFIFDEVIYWVVKEIPTNVRLPLLEVSNQEAVGCNFAKGYGAGEEYFFAHCIHDTLSNEALKSTKIIEKSTRKEICVSDMPRVCVDESESVVDAKLTVELSDEDELKKLISTMSCINCTININVQPKS